MAKVAIKTEISDQAAAGAFFTKFAEFEAALKSTPDAWQRASASAAATSKHYGELADHAARFAQASDDTANSVHRFAAESGKAAHLWDALGRSTTIVLKNVTELTKSLLAWTGLTGILGGVLSGGAFTGFASIAGNVSAARTSALAAGSSIGRQRAADISYSRFLGGAGGASFGSQIAQMQRSPEGIAQLKRLLPNYSTEQLTSADPYDLEGPLLQGAHQYIQGNNVPKSQLYNTPALSVIPQSALNAMTSGQIEEGEYGSAIRNYNSTRNQLGPTNPRAFQDFETLLETSKGKIEKTFIDRLTALDKPLGDLVTAFTNAAVKLVKSEAFGDVMAMLNKGANWLAAAVDKPDFRKGVDAFIAGIASLGPVMVRLAEGVVHFAQWLGVMPQGKHNVRYGAGGHTPYRIHVGSGAAGPAGGAPGSAGYGYSPSGATPASAPRGGRGGAPNMRYGGQAAAMDAASGYTANDDFYDAIIQAEGTARHGDPYNTSLGYMQPPKPLTEMTMDEVMQWGEQVRRAQGMNSSAKGAFQIVNTTQREAMAALHISGSERFSPYNQRRMAYWIAQRQGLGAWEGFKAHPEQLARARGAFRQAANGAPANDNLSAVRAKSANAGAGMTSVAQGKSVRLPAFVAFNVSQAPGSNAVVSSSQTGGSASGAQQ